MKISVLIVDDEPLARQGVELRLRSHHDFDVIGECSNGQEAKDAILKRKPDLVFLDIQMPLLSGIELLHALSPEQTPYTIFLTAFDEYAMRAFEVHAIDYLLKPVDDSRFNAALQHARRVLGGAYTTTYQERLRDFLREDENLLVVKPLSQFSIRSGKNVTFVSVDEIDFIESHGDYVRLHVGSKHYMLRESLTDLETRLDTGVFLRIHRSAIVRINLIARVDSRPNRDCIVTLVDGRSLRVSRTYSHHLRSLLRNDISSKDSASAKLASRPAM